MVIKELVAKIKYELDKNSVNKTDNSINKTKNRLKDLSDIGSTAWKKISDGANKTQYSIHGVGKEALYTAEQLKRMGAYQDKMGRWHGSNGKYLKINADVAQARANITSLQGSMQSLVNGAKMIGQAIVVAFAIDRIIAFTQAIQKSADEMMNLDGRLRTITKTNQERFAIEDKLYTTAQNNRQAMKEMGDLYYKVARSASRYGFSSDDSMRVTDVVSKSLTIGGASTAEAQASILQLGQALSSGILQGDELRSLDENASLLMQHIADYFGVDIGQLKKMGSEGELTSQEVIKAIIASGNAVDEEFSKMPITIGKSLQQASNLWDRFILRLERGTGFFSFIGKGLSNNIVYVSNQINALFDLFDKYDGSNEWFNTFQQNNPILYSIYQGFLNIKSIISEIGTILKPTFDSLKNVNLVDIFFNVVNVLKDVFSGLLPFIEPLILAVTRLAVDLFPLLKNTFMMLMPFIATGIGVIATAFGKIVQIITWIINLVAQLIENNQELVQGIINIGAIILAYVYGGFIAIIGAIGLVIQAIQWCYEQLVILKDIVATGLYQAFLFALQGVSLFFASIAQFFSNFITQTFNAVRQFINAFTNAIENVKTFFSDLGSYAIGILQDIANAISSWILDKIQWAIDKITNLKNFADGILSNIGSSISNAKYDITQNNSYTVGSAGEAASIQQATNSDLFGYYS